MRGVQTKCNSEILRERGTDFQKCDSDMLVWLLLKEREQGQGEESEHTLQIQKNVYFITTCAKDKKKVLWCK